MRKSIVCLGLLVASFTGHAFETAAVHRTEYAKPVPTPLCTAISKGDFDAVKKFVEYGADVNERSNGLTPLMVAARYNRVDIVEFLIGKGAAVDAKSENGFTALKYAELSKADNAAAFLRSYKKNS